MANTKDVDRKVRRKAKRQARTRNKKEYEALSLQQKKKLRKFEGSFKQFLAEQEKQKQEQAAAAEG